MAKLEGILPLRGTLQNITFTPTSNGVIAKVKSSLDKDRIYSDPAFDRTRENASDFGTAGKAAKLLFDAFRYSVKWATYQLIFSDIVQMMRRALDGDSVNERGSRVLTGADLSIIEGFNFNSSCALHNICLFPISTAINTAAGEAEISLPGYSPSQAIKAPAGATHYRLVGTAAELNFGEQKMNKVVLRKDHLSLADALAEGVSFSFLLTPGSTHPVGMSLGIEFYQLVGGRMYPLKGGSAHAIVRVECCLSPTLSEGEGVPATTDLSRDLSLPSLKLWQAKQGRGLSVSAQCEKSLRALSCRG